MSAPKLYSGISKEVRFPRSPSFLWLREVSPPPETGEGGEGQVWRETCGFCWFNQSSPPPPPVRNLYLLRPQTIGDPPCSYSSNLPCDLTIHSPHTLGSSQWDGEGPMVEGLSPVVPAPAGYGGVDSTGFSREGRIDLMKRLSN